MRKQYKSAIGRKFLLAAGVIALLILLFFLSFWITGMVLKSGQNPGLPQGGDAVVSPTPKPTYEQLEKTVIEQNKRIQELEQELANYRPGTPRPSATPVPITTVPPRASQTPAPSATSSARPSAAICRSRPS